MNAIIIRNGKIINRMQAIEADLLIKGDRIEKIASNIEYDGAYEEINAEGKYVIPGIIDDQVHFREPGLTHKANILTESRAAVAGGVTSFMEMPNTNPQSVTQELLEAKYQIGAQTSAANYSFYMGATNENVEEVLKTDRKKVCGVKIFMGSSTGNMLVDNTTILENLFSKVDLLIATHCEDEETVRSRRAMIIEQHGDNIDATFHPVIRNHEACYLSSSMAVDLAKKHNTRLHILHLTTAKELDLFDSLSHRTKKRITSEVCVHHLYFHDQMYPELGNKITCNPAIKSIEDRTALRNALRNNVLDVIATDHAPHTIEEKSRPYLKAPSGLPLIQHTLNLMMEINQEENYGMPFIVDKMCHAVADLFHVSDRGYLDEGKYADVVIVDPNCEWEVNQTNLRYKCGWSPLENHKFQSKVITTIINGKRVYDNDELLLTTEGKRLEFNRD